VCGVPDIEVSGLHVPFLPPPLIALLCLLGQKRTDPESLPLVPTPPAASKPKVRKATNTCMHVQSYVFLTKKKHVQRIERKLMPDKSVQASRTKQGVARKETAEKLPVISPN
jgi:hypothetical protein